MSSNPICKEVAEKLAGQLISNGYTMVTAESCTGGLIGAVLTSLPGSSAWFRGGIIAYDNSVKTALLGVPENTLQMHGAVSEQTVSAMAEGAAKKLNADCAVAVSGIAGPDGGTSEKPVGLVCIGVFCRGQVKTFSEQFSGGREEVREKTVVKSLRCLIESMNTRAVT